MNLRPMLQSRGRVEEFLRQHRLGLLTLLFTDMVGSTKLKQDLGDQEAVHLIKGHHALVRGLLTEFPEAEEIDTAGDSFFIVFAKPSDAVRFSLLLQSQLRRFGAAHSNSIRDRIGIHVGEVMIEERDGSKDLYGLQVDTCARVMSLGEGDQILLTRSPFDNARQVLKGQEIEGVCPLAWLSHGAYRLKGVEEPLEICEVGEVGAAVLQAPGDSEKVQRCVSPDAEPVLGWRPAIGQAVSDTGWVLQEKLGEGGFGEVWLAQHQTLKERRVFKFCFRADRVRSLRREVALFRIIRDQIGEHPHIVALREVYFDHPPYYVAMDYVAGRDLKSWSEAKGGLAGIPMETRLELVAQVADALQAAHQTGVIHRDVKPSNILLVEGRVPGVSTPMVAKLSDFGIGQVVSQEMLAGMTQAGFTQTLMGAGASSQTGTPVYMAPELLVGKPASAKSDIYSLGVILYQLLVGDFGRPLTTDWHQHIPDPLLREILTSCFAGDPAGRFERAGDLAVQLRQLEKRRAFVTRTKVQTKRAHAVKWGFAVLVAITLCVLGAVGLRSRPQAKESLASGLKVVNVEVVNPSSDRRKITIGVQFERINAVADLSQINLEVSWKEDASTVEFFGVLPGLVDTSLRNYLLFPVVFMPEGRTNSLVTDRVKVYSLDPATGNRLVLADQRLVLDWEVPPSFESADAANPRLGQAEARTKVRESLPPGLKVVDVDVVARSVSRDKMTILVGFERIDAIPTNSLITVEVSRKEDPSSVGLFVVRPAYVDKQYRNYLLFPATFSPQGRATNLISDRVVVYYLDPKTGHRSVIADETIVLRWSDGQTVVSATVEDTELADTQARVKAEQAALAEAKRLSEEAQARAMMTSKTNTPAGRAGK